MYTSLHVWLYLCRFGVVVWSVDECVHVWVYHCMCVCIYVSVYKTVSVCVCFCASVRFTVWIVVNNLLMYYIKLVCRWMCMYMVYHYVYVWIYLCIYMYVCACVCICSCVCVYNLKLIHVYQLSCLGWVSELGLNV